MRGRKPRSLKIAREDAGLLRQVARSETSPWFQVRRARILLESAAGARTRELAARLECDPATIWRTCRQYESSGMEGVLSHAPRSGSPERISPSGPSTTR